MDNQSNSKNQGIKSVLKFAKKKVESKNEYITEKFEMINIEKETGKMIVKIEFTLTTCIILLSNGKVFTKGSKNDFTLGREMNIENFYKFKEILFVPEEKESNEVVIFNISAGNEHVLALDSKMRLWGWGKNNMKQINPFINNDEIKRPIIISVPNNMRVVQIYALNNNSLIIGSGNLVYIWGSYKDKFTGTGKVKNDQGYLDKFVKMDKVSYFLSNDIKKNSNNFIDKFIVCRKLSNISNGLVIEDSLNKGYIIDKLNTEIHLLKTEISNKNEFNIKQMLDKGMKINDQRYNILVDLLNQYDSKLLEISNKKENLRKELMDIEDELGKKNIDLENNSKRIEEIESEIDVLNTEINILKNQFKKELSQEKFSTIYDKQNLINKSKVIKDSLNNNLNVAIVFIENIEKEKNEKSKKLQDLMREENEIYNWKYIIEDMIQIVLESNSLNSKNDASTKNRLNDRFQEYFKLSDKLDNCTFMKLNRKTPYKIVPDLLEKSNKELSQLTSEFDAIKSNFGENVAESIEIILNMISLKIELIKEQNNLVKCFYLILTNLQDEIKEKMFEINEKLVVSFNTYHLKHEEKEKEKNTKDIEYIYKDIILLYLKEVYSSDEVENFMPNNEDSEKMNYEKKMYLNEKKEELERLEARKNLIQIEEDLNFDDLVSFNYDKDEEEVKNLLDYVKKLI